MKYKMNRTQCVLALLVLQVGLAHSWEIAISAGDELRLYTNNTITSTIRFKSHNLTALAYDEVHNMMLYVDKQTNNDIICGYDLSYAEMKCFTERNGRNIHGIAFDPATDTVFFTDTNERSVNWISLKPGSVTNPNGNLLFKMDDGVPRDIVVDSCKGYIYWLNTNMEQPTIERARLDFSEREVFENITSVRNLEPHSLAFHQQTQAIYWIEPDNTNHTLYRLYFSKLNTTAKAGVIYYPDAFNPLFIHPLNTLTASKNKIFVVDFRDEVRRVYEFSVSKGSKDIKSIFTVHKDKKIDVGIVANYKIADQIQGQDCEALERRVITAPECDGPFCVHGTRVNGESVCKCTPGYSGERCDVSVCENYCLQGNCSFNDEGLPECRCDAGYSGIRCEVNDCHGYCLNDGNCSLNEENEPFCQCVGSYEGARCEGHTGEENNVPVCENYCLQGNCSFNNEGLPECRCDAGFSGIRCEVNDCHGYCLNDGNCSLNEEQEPVCQCVGSYEGARCEGHTGEENNVPVCENNCLQGNCSFNDEGLPECRCDAGYSGIRCEDNNCHGYCLNDGECSLNEENEPLCQCVGSYGGARCEANTNDTLTTTSSSCLTGGNLTLADFLSILRKPSSRKFLIVEV